MLPHQIKESEPCDIVGHLQWLLPLLSHQNLRNPKLGLTTWVVRGAKKTTPALFTVSKHLKDVTCLHLGSSFKLLGLSPFTDGPFISTFLKIVLKYCQWVSMSSQFSPMLWHRNVVIILWFAWFYRFNRYLPNVICKVWEVCQGNMVVQAQLSSSAFNILHQSFIFTFNWSVHMYSSEHTAIIVMVISVFNFSEFESFWTFEKFNSPSYLVLHNWRTMFSMQTTNKYNL